MKFIIELLFKKYFKDYIMNNLYNFLFLSIFFLVIDSIYLKTFSKEWNKIVFNIQGSNIQFKMISALITYIFIVFQVYYFIILKNKSLTDAFLLGLTTYAIFDFTNYTILKKWSLKMSLIDTIWGGLLYTLTVYLFREVIG